MTPVETLRALMAKATPGSWKAPTSPESIVNVWSDEIPNFVLIRDIEQHGDATGANVYGELGCNVAHEVRGPDATLIAAMHSALPALLDVAEIAAKYMPPSDKHKRCNEQDCMRCQLVAALAKLGSK